MGNLGAPEIIILILVALFVFGPERLPEVAAEAGRTLRKIRSMVQGATADLKAELPPEMADLDLRSMTPRGFVRKHLWEDDAPARPSNGSVRVPPPLPDGAQPPYDVEAT